MKPDIFLVKLPKLYFSNSPNISLNPSCDYQTELQRIRKAMPYSTPNKRINKKDRRQLQLTLPLESNRQRLIKSSLIQSTSKPNLFVIRYGEFTVMKKLLLACLVIQGPGKIQWVECCSVCMSCFHRAD